MDYADFVPTQRFQPVLSLSPDGREVAYTSNRTGQYDLWVAAVDGSAERCLTAFEGRAVRGIAWSPDGSRLAFTADTEGDEQHQVHLVAADGTDHVQLTDADAQHALVDGAFSHDGRFLAYAANDRDPLVQDLLVRDLTTGDVRRIESRPGQMLYAAGFSPNDRHLLVMAAFFNSDTALGVVDLDDEGLAELRLFTIAPDGVDVVHRPCGWFPDADAVLVCSDRDGEYLQLYRIGLDGSASPIADVPDSARSWDVEHAAVGAHGTLTWVVNDNGRSVLWTTAGGVQEKLHRHDLEGPATELVVDRDGITAVVLLAADVAPADVVAIDLRTGERRRLTDSRPAVLGSVQPVGAEWVEFATHDGRMIPATIYRPRGEGPFPVVVAIHGGPEAQDRPSYNYAGLYQYLLANGVGVMAPNVRGSTGYGKTYQSLIHRDWGGAELGDFEHAHIYLAGLDWVDADRIGVFGGSFGGFATLSCLSRLPDLWAAGVSVVGPSNLITLGRAAPPTWRAAIRRLIGDPDDDAEFLTERSPLTHADRIVAPLLVLQGANDPRVAQAESDQIVESLRSRDVDVEYVVYPDEGHGFTKRENEIDAFGRIGDFFLDRLAEVC